MTNPFQPPTHFESPPKVQAWPNLWSACCAGIKFAFRWVSFTVAPLLVIIFVACMGSIVFRAFVMDIWPDWKAPQFYMSIVVFVLLLFAAYLAACFWVCLVAAVAYGARYLQSR